MSLAALFRDAIASADLTDHATEIGRGIAEHDGLLATRCAAPGLAVDPAIDRHPAVPGRRDLDVVLGEHGAARVESDDVRGAITLAGHDQQSARLQGSIGNRRIAEDDARNPFGQSQDFRLVEYDRNRVSRSHTRHRSESEQAGKGENGSRGGLRHGFVLMAWLRRNQIAAAGPDQVRHSRKMVNEMQMRAARKHLASPR